MRGTAMEGNPVNPAHVNDKTIPKNHVNEETVHVRMGMLTEVWTLLRSNDPTTLLWMP